MLDHCLLPINALLRLNETKLANSGWGNTIKNMTNGPEISVLMPAHNAAEYLKESITSISGQLFQNFELIVVDDGSIDQTSAILHEMAQQDSRIIALRNEENRGIAFSLNRAISVARGHLLARMDSDDVALPNRLGIQQESFLKNKDLVLCGSNAVIVDQLLSPLYVTGLPIDDIEIRCVSIFENPFCHPTVMMRASALLKVGSYDEEYTTTQDYDLWTKLLSVGEVKNIEESLVKIRKHSGGFSSDRGHIQLENTIKIQTRNAINLVGHQGVSEDIFRSVTMGLFILDKGARQGQERRGDVVSQALALLAIVERKYRDRTPARFKGYVYGRCLLLLFFARGRVGWRCLNRLTILACIKGTTLGLSWMIRNLWRNISVVGLTKTIQMIQHLRLRASNNEVPD
jgi:hypothetical protein